jgi:hypothetical protein
VQSYDGINSRSTIHQYHNRFDVCHDQPGPRVITVKQLSITLQVMSVRHWVGHEPG